MSDAGQRGETGGGDRWRGAAQAFYDARAEEKGESRRFNCFVRAYRKLVGGLSLAGQTRLLDVGCGCGELGAAVAGVVGRYVGVDISKASLAVAKRRNPGGCFVCGDMTALPVRGEFDVVALVTALEFCEDKAGALQEVRRLMKADGVLYIEVRNSEFALYRWLTRLRLPGWRRATVAYPADGFRDWSVSEWQGLLQQAGFVVVGMTRAVRPYAYGSWLMRCRNALIWTIDRLNAPAAGYMVGFVCRSGEG